LQPTQLNNFNFQFLKMHLMLCKKVARGLECSKMKQKHFTKTTAHVSVIFKIMLCLAALQIRARLVRIQLFIPSDPRIYKLLPLLVP
jgi:hypothetical protein